MNIRKKTYSGSTNGERAMIPESRVMMFWSRKSTDGKKVRLPKLLRSFTRLEESMREYCSGGRQSIICSDVGFKWEWVIHRLGRLFEQIIGSGTSAPRVTSIVIKTSLCPKKSSELLVCHPLSNWSGLADHFRLKPVLLPIYRNGIATGASPVVTRHRFGIALSGLGCAYEGPVWMAA